MRKSKYRFYWKPLAFQNRSRMYNRWIRIQQLMPGRLLEI